jgi:hypothetical protein
LARLAAAAGKTDPAGKRPRFAGARLVKTSQK